MNRSTRSTILLIALPRSIPQWWRNYSAAPLKSSRSFTPYRGIRCLARSQCGCCDPKRQRVAIKVRVVAGLSYLEPVCAALGLDPLERDLQLLDATRLADVSLAAMMGALLPTRPALIAQVYNRRLASGVKLALGEIYPDDWEVALVRWAGMPEERVERRALAELDRGAEADHLTTLYVPPLTPLAAARVPEGLRYVVARLRAPDGCPWDREQTHQSLRPFVLEEAYEVAEVLDEWDGSAEIAEKLAEELGDLLLQVYLQAQVAHDEDLFHIGDVFQGITEKLIRRHPHVFGEVEARDAAQVLRNWETLKKAERAARGEEVASESVLRGIPKSAPALYQAYELSKKAAKAGFEWPTDDGAVEKVAEEARELVAAVASGDPERRARGTGRRPLYPCGGGTQTRPGAGARAARTRTSASGGASR